MALASIDGSPADTQHFTTMLPVKVAIRSDQMLSYGSGVEALEIAVYLACNLLKILWSL